MTAGYTWVVRKFVRFSLLSILLVAGAAALTGGVFSATPKGFLPEKDQGGMFAIVQLPQGASQNRTSEVSREVERIMKADPAVWHVIEIGRASGRERVCQYV